MDQYILAIDSEEAMVSLGRKWGKLLGPGTVIELSGDLGAGKTHLAKGIGEGLGVKELITSPTFTIYNIYKGRVPFYHIDGYRLKSLEEVYGTGLEEAFFEDGVTVVEWGELIRPFYEGALIEVTIEKVGDTHRVVTISGELEAFKSVFGN